MEALLSGCLSYCSVLSQLPEMLHKAVRAYTRGDGGHLVLFAFPACPVHCLLHPLKVPPENMAFNWNA